MVGADKVQGKCPPRDAVFWGSPYHAGLYAWCATPGAARTAPRFVGIANWIKAARAAEQDKLRATRVPAGLLRGEIAAPTKPPTSCQLVGTGRLLHQEHKVITIIKHVIGRANATTQRPMVAMTEMRNQIQGYEHWRCGKRSKDNLT